jgi:pimeloyl-ACP methyl ester carboxylesterase
MRLLLWQLSTACAPHTMMIEPKLNYLPCPHVSGGVAGSHRVAYWDWGNPTHPHVVVCLHGVSRQGRDFDTLARALVGPDGQRCRVVSVDVAGRGESDWLKDPQMYQLSTYGADMMALLASLRASGTVKTIDWVGTSMGGLIGIAVAAQPTAQLRKLVLNDVGPIVQWDALQRIGSYLGNDPRFASEAEAVEYLRVLSLSFGPHTPAQWLALSRPMLRQEGAQFKLHYDPAIAVTVKAATPESAAKGEALLWSLYDQIACDTLLVRGAESDLISPETARAMQQRGPKARMVEFAGVGHAPTLVAQDQIDTVTNFIFA